MQVLRPKCILVSHNGLLTIDESTACLDSSLYWAEEIRHRIVTGYLAGKLEEELADEFKQICFCADISRIQIEDSFLINARHMVSMLARECATTHNSKMQALQ